jgi:hypothetical protein
VSQITKIGNVDLLSLEAVREAAANGTGGVLIDNSSLTVATHFFADAESASVEKWREIKRGIPRSARNAGPITALNLIQSMIIYERLLVDGVVLAAMKKERALAEMFVQAIASILVSHAERRGILSEVEARANNYISLSKTDSELRSAVEEAHGIDFGDASAGKTVRAAVADADALNSLRRFDPFGFDEVFKNSDNHVARTIYYAVLSEYVQLPYAPHPLRCPLYALIHPKRADATKGVLETFTNSIDNAIPETFRGYDLNIGIPPVAQYILATTDNPRDLQQRIIDVRESKHAKDFRRFCGYLQAAMWAGFPAKGEVRRLFNELRGASQSWAKDVREQVDYRTRNIRITLGVELLKAEGEGGAKVKDRILWGGRYKSLLFLNDLLRGWNPHSRRSG